MMKRQPLTHAPLPSEQPCEDDIATEEDLRDIACARAEYERGETVAHKDIDWGK